MHFWHRPGGPSGPSQAGLSLPLPREPSSQLRLLDPSALQLRRDGHRLQAREAQEEDWQDVNVVRLFPLSEPDRWISVLDKEGKEIGVLENLRDLPRAERLCLQQELQRRYLVPQISRILACRDRFDLVEWTVETDRGKVTFLTRNLREQVQEPIPRRLTLTDVEGNRYDVPDLDALDSRSRRWLEERL